MKRLSPLLLASFSSLAIVSGCVAEIGSGEDGNPDKGDGTASIRVGNFPGPDGIIRAPYELKGNTAVVGGDILWHANSALSIGAAAGPFTRWPGGVIPYVNTINSTALKEGVAAWNAVSNTTGITFVERTNQSDYLNVVERDGCYSYLGFTGGAQELSLGTGCYREAAIHELGHAIGLMHEHTRADRASFVRFNWDNVVGGENGTFAQVNLGITQGATNYSEYDYKSIMHYRNVNLGPQYLINPNIPLFEIVGGGPSTIDNKDLSAKDISGVAAMYAGFGGAGNGGGGNGGGGNGGGGNGGGGNGGGGNGGGGNGGGGNDGGGTTCQIATCSEYGMTEGECYEFGTGSFECKSSCLERVSVCQNTQSDGWSCNNGEQIPANYYCDGIVDCNDNSDETSCGGTDNGGSGTGGSSWGACDVSGFAGECIDTSTSICNGTLFTGYCPGGSEIRCCI